MSLDAPDATEVCVIPSVNSVESMFDMGLSSVFGVASWPKILGCMSRIGLSHKY